MKTFEELGLSEKTLEALDRLGFEKPSEIQEKAIPLALAGKDILGGSATGSGKTLAFSAPIIEKLKPNQKVQALILAPTRELAEQVAESITKFSSRRLNVLPIYGGVDIERQIRKIRKADVIVGTPGRILDHLNRRTLTFRHVKFLVLDEVDRMFDMGFHRDVEKILGQCPKERQTMLFSATISKDIDHLAKKYTKNPKEISVESYVDASKLKQVYYDVPNNMKFSLFVHLIKKETSDLVMVFCSTRRNADVVTENLNKLKIRAMAIHGGMPQNKRMRTIEKFNKEGVDVLVCTDVAARGLDIKGVSHVYNYDLPSKAEDYVHRIGRTARAGEEGKAIIILCSRDYENFRNILQNESLKIEEEPLPKFEQIRVRMGGDRRSSYGRDNRGHNRRGPPRRHGRDPGRRRDSNRRPRRR